MIFSSDYNQSLKRMDIHLATSETRTQTLDLDPGPGL